MGNTFAQFTNCADQNTCDVNLPQVAANQAFGTTVLQLAFGVIGAIAVIYIIYASIHFARSQGDPQTIAKARMGIVYALIGLAIAVSAEVIVTFVLGRI